MLIICLVMASFCDGAKRLFTDLRLQPSKDVIEATIGTQEQQEVGMWLRKFSKPADLIGTNDVLDSNHGGWRNFALMNWSHRKFLMLGPYYSGKEVDMSQQYRVSIGFADSPSQIIANELQTYGVDWFIVDLRQTKHLSWGPYAKEKYRINNYVVLQLG